MRRVWVALAVTLVLSGCDQPKIDTSSDESMKSSVQKVRASLPEDQRASYDDALKVVAFSHLNVKDFVQAGMTNNTAGVEAQMKSDLSGKTGQEVINYAEMIRKERAEKEKAQALQEIAELEQKQTNAQANLKKLEAFAVTRSRFYFEKKKYGNIQPVIALSVENGTSESVSRADFRGVISSPGRQVPWYTDTFSYQIPGGLEPGEKADWRLAPSPLSDWGNVEAPADAVFTVTVIRIDDPQGNQIFGDADFTERDASRLAELKGLYPGATP